MAAKQAKSAKKAKPAKAKAAAKRPKAKPVIKKKPAKGKQAATAAQARIPAKELKHGITLPRTKRQPGPNRFLAMLAKQPVICAEGYLFEMEKRGYVKIGPFVPEVSLTHPDAVRQLHLEFARAGSDIVEAFTYYAQAAKLRLIGKEHILEPLNRQALRIAKQVADETGTLLAGNMCNTAVYNATDPASFAEVRQTFRDQAKWAQEEGAELVIAETFDNLGEALLALEEIKLVGLPAVVTFALANWTDGSKKGDKMYLQDDVHIVDACRQVVERGAAVVGLNCHRGPGTILAAMTLLRERLGPSFPLAALPVGYRTTCSHATMQELSEKGKTYTDLDPHTCTRDDFYEFGLRMKELGVQYVGTCCGCSSHHVRSLALALGRKPESAKNVADLKMHFVFGAGSDETAAVSMVGSQGVDRCGSECGATASLSH